MRDVAEPLCMKMLALLDVQDQANDILDGLEVQEDQADIADQVDTFINQLDARTEVATNQGVVYNITCQNTIQGMLRAASGVSSNGLGDTIPVESSVSSMITDAEEDGVIAVVSPLSATASNITAPEEEDDEASMDL